MLFILYCDYAQALRVPPTSLRFTFSRTPLHIERNYLNCGFIMGHNLHFIKKHLIGRRSARLMLAPAWPALAVQRRQQFSNNHANLLKDWHCSEKSSTSTTFNADVKLGLHFSTWRRLNVPDMLEESSSFHLEYQIGNKSLFNVQKQKAIWYTSEARDIAATYWSLYRERSLYN